MTVSNERVLVTVHVRDVGDTFVTLLAEFDDGFDQFILGTRTEYSVRKVVERTSEALGELIDIIQDDERVRESDRPHLQADPSKIRDVFGGGGGQNRFLSVDCKSYWCEGTIHMRNIVFVTFDDLRADHCSYLGYKRETTPNLDAMAAEGELLAHQIAAREVTNAMRL